MQDVSARTRDRNAFQELDHVALFAGVSKWTRRIDDVSRAEDYVDPAMIAANSGRPGPVVLLLPRDVLDLPAEPAQFVRTQNLGSFPLDRPRPSAEAVARAATLIANARAPIIIAGGGIHGSVAVDELAALQRLAHLPVATTNMGKGAVDETLPLSLGVAANVTGARGPAHFHLPLISQADVVLLVGTRTNENGTDNWTLTSPTATYIHIDVDALEVGRNYEAVRLVGDAKSALADLTEALCAMDLSKRKAAGAALVETIGDRRRKHVEAAAAARASDRMPLAPERVLAELDALLRPDDIVTADASYASIWVTSCLTARRAGQRFLLPRGLAGLGWGYPLAIGAKLARPGARVVSIVGDGGFAHVWSEIETAVRENISSVVIILDNAVLGYQRHAENYFFGKTTSAIAMAHVDHAAMARAVGAAGVTVQTADEIRPALKAALAFDGTTVLDVIVDPDAYAPVRAFDGNVDRINVDAF